jgi:molybdopterin synthase catalytic subunit
MTDTSPSPPAVVRTHTRLTPEPLSVESAYAFAADPAAGAVVVFTGTVRDHSEGRRVAGLEYEAFEERARGQLAALAASVAQRWPQVRAVWLEHRVGSLGIGEPAVVVAVSAAHREEAFVAARTGIDELKAEVAIWKKELWSDGGGRWPGTD